MLCYTSTMSVDTENNVITHISAEHASRKDSQLLIKNTKETMARLEDCGLQVNTVLADAAPSLVPKYGGQAGFSSGENYAMLEALEIDANIPLHGTYETHRNGFKYDGRRNAYICPQG